MLLALGKNKARINEPTTTHIRGVPALYIFLSFCQFFCDLSNILYLLCKILFYKYQKRSIIKIKKNKAKRFRNTKRGK